MHRIATVLFVAATLSAGSAMAQPPAAAAPSPAHSMPPPGGPMGMSHGAPSAPYAAPSPQAAAPKMDPSTKITITLGELQQIVAANVAQAQAQVAVKAAEGALDSVNKQVTKP